MVFVVGSVGYLLFMVVNFWICDLWVAVVCAKGITGECLVVNLVMLLVFMLCRGCFVWLVVWVGFVRLVWGTWLGLVVI